MTALPIPVLACSRCFDPSPLTQRCAVCGHECCPLCYGTWTALACEECRVLARRRRLELVR